MMEGALWGVLLFLLLSPGGDTQQRFTGELCRTWTPELVKYMVVFWCPDSHGPPNATFCCGTCEKPHCCSEEKDRLEQKQCYLDMLTTTPVPQETTQSNWYYLLFIMSLFTIAVSYTCATVLTTPVRNCLRKRQCCGFEQHQEIQEDQLVEMDSRRGPSINDMQPSSRSLETVSLGVEEPSSPEVPSPTLVDTAVQVHGASDGIPENETIVLSSSALQNMGVSRPIVEGAVETEALAASTQ